MFSQHNITKGEPINLANFAMDSSIDSLVIGAIDSFLSHMFGKIQFYHPNANVVRVLVKIWDNNFFDCFAYPIIPRAAYHDCGEYGSDVSVPAFWDHVAQKASANNIEVYCPAEDIYIFTQNIHGNT